jgi:aminoglycoside/choline kinase family phosphotransferase
MGMKLRIIMGVHPNRLAAPQIMSSDPRLETLRLWLAARPGFGIKRLEPASADASFRRYFRLWPVGGGSLIVMDAPPDKEDLATYLRVSRLLEQCGMHVPHVHADDTLQGYAVLEDLGGTHMLTALNEGADPGVLYGDALAALADLQLRGDAASGQLPPYDAATLWREMQLLPDWYCARHLGIDLDVAESEVLAATFELLIVDALAQPRVFVHRDYHSRNLMMTAARSPGVIDFQDALRGPVGYDLASLLKDCYIAWPRARVESWVAQFREQLLAAGPSGAALAGESQQQFLRWFDLIGLQRHIKVLGIFARLCWRDGKSGYLADLPRTLQYVRDVAAAYPELAQFHELVETRLVPGLSAANERALAAST